MTVHTYGVLDANGIKLQDITADNGLIGTGWWPGFGAALIDEGPLAPAPPPPPAPAIPATWKVYAELATPMNIGDEYIAATATVIPAAQVTTLTPLPPANAVGPTGATGAVAGPTGAAL